MIKLSSVSILGLIFILSGCRTQTDPMQGHIQQVTSYLTGIMETSAQAKAIPDAPSVRMTTCEVKLKNTDSSVQHSKGVFLYQEQALTRNLSKPYRQRVLNILPSIDKNSIESVSFKPINSTNWIGLCQKPLSERLISVQEIENVNCSVFLKPVGTQYIGETQPEGCVTNLKGAVKVTNRIKLDEKGMETQDRGFDAQGKQVWGAKNRPYQYQKIEVKSQF
ncbi:chromophore lyase CpcT/CpeT [Planktothrix paucivesiculata]|uniref:Chromophore lyase CpcT/CpeT n=1 Tax=Planktothrix paucivesiculata PCC 9631 TaxID=671071 RepID=A0A7Z9BII9_9CYAN|nr:chromophore lyase CpcT/CpeT [Planktothrix paucivesiculata]VXD12542.1 Chromophore lyase CpcT/CpeT 3 [Planktothrix paucivesiculata PCC 9631]